MFAKHETLLHYNTTIFKASHAYPPDCSITSRKVNSRKAVGSEYKNVSSALTCCTLKIHKASGPSSLEVVKIASFSYIYGFTIYTNEVAHLLIL